MNETIKPTPEDRTTFEKVYGVLKALKEDELKAFLTSGVILDSDEHNFTINPHLESGIIDKVSALTENPGYPLNIATLVGINAFGALKGLRLNPLLAQ